MTNPLMYQPTVTKDEFSGLTNKSNGDVVNSDGSFSSGAFAGSGTLTVAYGKYFFGTGLICENYAFSLSPEVVEDGTPLYGTFHATFKPKIMPDIFQFRRYFRGIRTGEGSFDSQLGSVETASLLTDTVLDKVQEFGDAGASAVANTLSSTINGTVKIFSDPLSTLLSGFK